MISTDLIKILGALTVLICALSVKKCWRLQYVPLHWLFPVAIMIGAAGVTAFYFEIDRGVLSMERLTSISRLLWFFVLLNTALMAGSVLVYRE